MVAPKGVFVPTGRMTAPRLYHTATLLPNGKVLIAGGYDGSIAIFASAELYDPSTGTFAATGSMSVAREHHTATLLPNGKVLITGGDHETPGGGVTLASAEVYDPSAGTFTATGSMSAARYWYTATLLPNGKVLIAGAADGHASAELYDPSTGRFMATGNMVVARMFHRATLLGNGKVLIVGGVPEQNLNGGALDASPELYDPNAGTFAATRTMTTIFGGFYHHTATLLRDGRVLVAGQPHAGPSAELYDPSTGTFTATDSVIVQRMATTATLLPDGMVLIAGGWGSAGGLADAELYDPCAGTFAATGSMSVARSDHTATLLPNGQVLIAGGDYQGTAELYE
jgi:WD40 repeat protein